MLDTLKKYAVAGVAWEASSWFTLYQMSVSRAIFPDVYEATMGIMTPIAVWTRDVGIVAKDMCVAVWEVCWEFLRAS